MIGIRLALGSWLWALGLIRYTVLLALGSRLWALGLIRFDAAHFAPSSCRHDCSPPSCWIDTFHGNSQLMKLTAPMAMPTPKTMPAMRRLEPPSPKAKEMPPTTMAIRLRALEMVLVKLSFNTVTAFS